jgi:hypothetical protein
MRVVMSRYLLAMILPMFLAGCGASFPGFSAIEQPYLYDLPVSSVTTQVQCEIRDFLSDPEKSPGAFFGGPIKIDLTLQTDFNGSVQYVGVDFSKAGLDSIAKLIAQTNGRPSLGAKVQGKKTVSAAFTTQFDPKDIADPKSREQFKQHCDDYEFETKYDLMRQLSLKQWLSNYFKAMHRDMSRRDDEGKSKKLQFASASLTQVKLSTQFQIGVDVAFGTNPFFPHPFVIIPFSGLNLDFNPSASHKLDITLPMCNPAGNNGCYLNPEGGRTKSLQDPKCTQVGNILTCTLPSATAPAPKDKRRKPDGSNVSADVANKSPQIAYGRVLRTAAVSTQ